MPQHLPRPARRPDDHARTPRSGPPRRRGPRGAPRAEHAAHPGLDHGRDRDAVRARRDAPGARPRRAASRRSSRSSSSGRCSSTSRRARSRPGRAPRRGSAARPVIVDGSSTQVSHGETSVETGAMLGMNAHALGIRHDLILGEGNRFMRDAKQGIDDYLAATGDERVVPDRQPPVRHRPPDPVAGRPALAAGAVPGRPGRPDDHDELGLLAELRQAALGRAGHRHADDPLRGARPARPPRGLPADGRPRSRPRRPTPRRRAARSP